MADSFCWFCHAGLARAGGRWSGLSWWSVVWSELVVGFFLLVMYFPKYNQSSILR
jgi:hypothetical protein